MSVVVLLSEFGIDMILLIFRIHIELKVGFLMVQSQTAISYLLNVMYCKSLGANFQVDYLTNCVVGEIFVPEKTIGYNLPHGSMLIERT